MTGLPPSGLGAFLAYAALAAFCAVWVLIASRRRKVRLAIQQQNLRRTVDRERARNYQPERVVTR